MKVTVSYSCPDNKVHVPAVKNVYLHKYLIIIYSTVDVVNEFRNFWVSEPKKIF